MHVLVTGGAGFIGSHTAKALARAGFTPVTVDNLSLGHRWAVRWGPFVHGDLADAALLRRVMREYRIAAVLHFAADASVAESVRDPAKYFNNNVTNSLHLLAAMRETGVAHIVFSSTCATYGRPQSLPIQEEHPQFPMSPYGESKLFVERALHWYRQAYDLNWVTLRYFNAAGADPEGELGEEHDPETHLIPLAIRAALHSQTLEVFGADYPTADGTALRDYIHVVDLASAHVQALCQLLEKGGAQALNLGNGVGYTVRQVIETVERLSGRSVPVRIADRRPGDPAVLVADASLAKEQLPWQPRFASLDDMVGTALEWYRRPELRCVSQHGDQRPRASY